MDALANFNLSALLPYIITGLNIAGGGAWNASIVAEYTQYKGETYSVIGLGAVINQATASGDYPMLLAATLTMIITVVALSYLLWQRLQAPGGVHQPAWQLAR